MSQENHDKSEIITHRLLQAYHTFYWKTLDDSYLTRDYKAKISSHLDRIIDRCFIVSDHDKESIILFLFMNA